MSATQEIPTTLPIGRNTPRVDGPLKVSGKAQYASDFHFPGQLYAVPVEATIASGRVVSLDTAGAEKMPGVRAIYHRGNIGKIFRSVLGQGFEGIVRAAEGQRRGVAAGARQLRRQRAGRPARRAAARREHRVLELQEVRRRFVVPHRHAGEPMIAAYINSLRQPGPLPLVQPVILRSTHARPLATPSGDNSQKPKGRPHQLNTRNPARQSSR